MCQRGPEPLATLARALRPHTPGVRSNDSHCLWGPQLGALPLQRAQTRGCRSFVSPGLAGQDSRSQAREFGLR